jgi:hypothetical protein
MYQLTDKGLAHLNELMALKMLDFSGTQGDCIGCFIAVDLCFHVEGCWGIDPGLLIDNEQPNSQSRRLTDVDARRPKSLNCLKIAVAETKDLLIAVQYNVEIIHTDVLGNRHNCIRRAVANRGSGNDDPPISPLYELGHLLICDGEKGRPGHSSHSSMESQSVDHSS